MIHDSTLTLKNREALCELAQRYGQTVVFHDAGERFEKLNLKARNLDFQGFRGTMYRLMIPDMIRTSRVIYLDCDIVVNTDIYELWEQNLEGHTLGAVRDEFAIELSKGKKISWRLKLFLDLLDVDPMNYFNAGVLLMDLDRLRERYDVVNSMLAFFDEYGSCATFYDQDFLNWLFAGDVKLLDSRFNRIDAANAGESTLRGSIWHMAGEVKPWNGYTRPFVDDLYWRCLRLTPYCTSDEELLGCVLRAMAASPLVHLHSSGCVKRLLKQLEDNIFRGHVWTVPAVLWKTVKKRVFGKSLKRTPS